MCFYSYKCAISYRSFLNMGIDNLMKVIQKHAPGAIKEYNVTNLEGRKLAIDANICMYQFQTAAYGKNASILVSTTGESTNHLSGLFYRVLNLVTAGIIPIFIFDGDVPDLKKGEVQ